MGKSMKTYQMLIDYYKAIEDSSAKMLDAARAEDWDEVVRFEGTCAVLIEQLRHKARSEELLPEQRMEKTRILRLVISRFMTRVGTSSAMLSQVNSALAAPRRLAALTVKP